MTALEHGLTVVTGNGRHFEPTDARVLNPFADEEPDADDKGARVDRATPPHR